MPEHRAVLGVDVMGAGGNEGHALREVHDSVGLLVPRALRLAGVGTADSWEDTGDGVLATYPSGLLGALVEAADRLDRLARERNRRRKPDIRLRVALEVGPVGREPGLYRAKIDNSRLLGADAFRELFARCVADADAATALIMSTAALDAVFAGDYAHTVRRSEFAPLPVRNKEVDTQAWVRMPGVPLPSTPRRAPATDHAVTNTADVVHGVQAGVINGGVSFG